MKESFEKLLQLNLEINSFLKLPEKEFNENFGKLLQEKDSLIKKLEKLKESMGAEFSRLKDEELKETWQKIQNLEKENLSLLQNQRNSIQEEAFMVKKHSRAISSYKFKKEQEPRLFDDSY